MDKRYNSGQWTEARFRSFIRGALRSASIKWPPRYETLKKACTGPKINERTGRIAKHFRCAECGEDYPAKDVQVDHKIPIGVFESWDLTVEHMFCESDNLQVLCKGCHGLKTKMEREQSKLSKGVLREKQRVD